MKKISLIKCKKQVIYVKKKIFSTDDDNKRSHKVRDHCHYTENYRRVPDDNCNVRCKTPREIPVVFHNGSTYD